MPSTIESQVVSREARELQDRVLEAAYRWMMADLKLHERAPQLWFVEGIDGSEASDDVVGCLADADHPVKKSSVANTALIRDRETGVPGVLLKAGSIQRLKPDVVHIQVEAEFNSAIAGPASEGAALILVRDGVHWVVHDAERTFGIGSIPAASQGAATVACSH